MSPFLLLVMYISAAQTPLSAPPPISPEHPLIFLQTPNSFGDSDEAPANTDKPAEAVKHGRDVVRLWNLLPEDIKPCCQLQVEIRVRDHALRYDLFRRMLLETQAAGVPVSVQIADPDDEFVFEPEYAEKLLDEFPCIRSVMLSEMQFAHYARFNVERYAVPPHTRYAIDILQMAARHGRHVLIVLQGLKWLHISADVLNLPLLEAMREYADYVIPVNEHIEPRHLVRQTAAWGLWLGGYASSWGIEPQSWWYESSFMNGPGVFGDHLPPQAMPPALYRAMILQGAAMGATCYSFEPFWDLFDGGNNRCWIEVILPTLREVINKQMIPSRDEVSAKTKVAYRTAPAADINAFHRNLRDLDWISDDGLLAQAAYGVWQPMLEHELIPNKGNWFIPLLPPGAPQSILDRFSAVFEPGQCNSVEEWADSLKRYYPAPSPEGTAWSCSIHGYAYVMQTHENLYERQSYALDLPKPIRSLSATAASDGLHLSWPADPGATKYFVLRAEGPLDERTSARFYTIAEVTEPAFTRQSPQEGIYAVTAETSSKERKTGSVNYLDYLVFSETVSEPAEYACAGASGNVRVIPVPEPPDTRPERQIVYPTFEGVSEKQKSIADEIVARIDALKQAYEAMDWRGVMDFYSPHYEDANGFHSEYASRAWKWWFRRNNKTYMLRQIRQWDFADYAAKGLVHVKMFTLYTAVRRDDQPFGYDGLVRFPRHKGAEVTYTWVREEGVWRIVQTNPATPNLEEILWNSRPMDKEEKLIAGFDE